MAIHDVSQLAFEGPVLVRSIESISRVYLRFSNRTSRPVDVYWRDFNGLRHRYACLLPGMSKDINTFLSHPWEFTDTATKETFVINNQPIFRAPALLGGMRFRTNWNITVRVRSLRYTALLSVAVHVRNSRDASALELPRPLAEELAMLINMINVSPPEAD